MSIVLLVTYILASKERHNELMEQVKQLSQKVHRGLKSESLAHKLTHCFLSLLGLDEEIKRDELGPNRHTAEFRIKKSQVLLYLYYLVV